MGALRRRPDRCSATRRHRDEERERAQRDRLDLDPRPCRAASSAPRRATRTPTVRRATRSRARSASRRPAPCGAARAGSGAGRARAVSGTSTAACVSWASAARTTASLRRSRRQQPMASMSIAAAHRNGSCPSSSASTSAGLTSTATAHQPRRSSGKLQNVAQHETDEPGAEHEGHAPLAHERPQQHGDHPRYERVGEGERVAVREHRHVEGQTVAVPKLLRPRTTRGRSSTSCRSRSPLDGGEAARGSRAKRRSRPPSRLRPMRSMPGSGDTAALPSSTDAVAVANFSSHRRPSGRSPSVMASRYSARCCSRRTPTAARARRCSSRSPLSPSRCSRARGAR